MNNTKRVQAEEKRILKLAGLIQNRLPSVPHENFRVTDSLTMGEVRQLLEYAALLADAVLDEGVEVVVHE